jgi:hypothetical protein
MKETKYSLKVILNRHVKTLHDKMSDDQITTIINDITDIVEKITKHESDSFMKIFSDLFQILGTIYDISSETKAQIISDIIDYVIKRIIL